MESEPTRRNTRNSRQRKGEALFNPVDSFEHESYRVVPLRSRTMLLKESGPMHICMGYFCAYAGWNDGRWLYAIGCAVSEKSLATIAIISSAMLAACMEEDIEARVAIIGSCGVAGRPIPKGLDGVINELLRRCEVAALALNRVTASTHLH